MSRGARHHVFSAVAHDRADVLRRLVAEDPAALERRMSRFENRQTALHLAVQRRRPEMVALLLELGADPNGRWMHWDAEVVPLHLAVLGDHPDVVRLLLAAGADPRIRDGKHDSDAIGWAEFFGRRELRRLFD